MDLNRRYFVPACRCIGRLVIESKERKGGGIDREGEGEKQRTSQERNRKTKNINKKNKEHPSFDSESFDVHGLSRFRRHSVNGAKVFRILYLCQFRLHNACPVFFSGRNTPVKGAHQLTECGCCWGSESVVKPLLSSPEFTMKKVRDFTSSAFHATRRLGCWVQFPKVFCQRMVTRNGFGAGCEKSNFAMSPGHRRCPGQDRCKPQEMAEYHRIHAFVICWILMFLLSVGSGHAISPNFPSP